MDTAISDPLSRTQRSKYGNSSRSRRSSGGAVTFFTLLVFAGVATLTWNYQGVQELINLLPLKGVTNGAANGTNLLEPEPAMGSVDNKGEQRGVQSNTLDKLSSVDVIDGDGGGIGTLQNVLVGEEHIMTHAGGKEVEENLGTPAVDGFIPQEGSGIADIAAGLEVTNGSKEMGEGEIQGTVFGSENVDEDYANNESVRESNGVADTIIVGSEKNEEVSGKESEQEWGRQNVGGGTNVTADEILLQIEEAVAVGNGTVEVVGEGFVFQGQSEEGGQEATALEAPIVHNEMAAEDDQVIAESNWVSGSGNHSEGEEIVNTSGVEGTGEGGNETADGSVEVQKEHQPDILEDEIAEEEGV